MRLSVLPIHDNDSDVASTELSESFADALKQFEDLRVISPQHVDAIVKYQGISGVENQSTDTLLEHLKMAKDAFLHFKTKECLRISQKLDERFKANPEWINDRGEIWSEVLLIAALASHALGNGSAVLAYLERLVRLAPKYKLDPEFYPPSLRRQFQQAQKRVRAAGTGTLVLESNPPVVPVLINGIHLGVTPLTIPQLPSGKYHVVLGGEHYRKRSSIQVIKVGETVHVKERMQWRRKNNNKNTLLLPKTGETSTVGSVKAEVAAGVMIAEQAKLDRLITVDVDGAERADGGITLRVIDRALKVGSTPLILPLHKNRQHLQQELSRMTAQLIPLVKRDPGADPLRSVDPVGTGDPALLGKRSQFRRPLVWSLIGAVIVGGIIAGVALASSSGGKSAPAVGGVTIRFK